MAQLFFRYGSMNSGKSFEIMKVAHNYEEQNKSVVILTSGLDNRDKIGFVSSRIGMRREALPLYNDTDAFELVSHIQPKPSCVLLDEAHLVTKEHILQLAKVVDELKIPVICYGLKNDFQNQLFESSATLLIYADKIEEIKTICWFCEKKAIMNLRVDSNGKPTYVGEQVFIGGNESYFPVCRRCYKNPPL